MYSCTISRLLIQKQLKLEPLECKDPEIGQFSTLFHRFRPLFLSITHPIRLNFQDPHPNFIYPEFHGAKSKIDWARAIWDFCVNFGHFVWVLGKIWEPYASRSNSPLRSLRSLRWENKLTKICYSGIIYIYFFFSVMWRHRSPNLIFFNFKKMYN